MPLKVNVAGVWKDAVPKVNVGGAWKDASSFVKAGGLWYQASSNGLNIIIDSATTLYDFNLKAYMQGAGIWPASGPVVINELRITARTVITQNVGSEVVDVEIRNNNSAPFRTVPRGYKTVTVQNAPLWQHYNYQEDPDLYPAFTTGDSWPVGSSIKTFVVDGVIYGKGADGFGPPVSYDGRVEGTDGTFVLSSQGCRTIAAGWCAMTLRHAYPALKLTLPVLTLSVNGGVYGGGAASTCLTLSAYPTGSTDQQTHPTPIANWPARLTQEFLITTPLVFNNTGGKSYGFAASNPFVVHGLYGPDALFWAGFHGGGGGQGGGVGARAAKTPPMLAGASAAYIAGRGILNGGDGSVGAPGAGAAALFEYYDSDTKYGSGEAMLPEAGTFAGLPWGTEITSKTFKYDRKDAGGGRAVVPPTTVATITEGMHPTLANTRTFFSKAGAAILGAANVASYASLAQIKGKRL